MNRFITVSVILILTPIAFPMALLYVVADMWRCWLEGFIGDAVSGAEAYKIQVKK